MVVLEGWVFSYERCTPVGYGPEGPLLQEEAGHCWMRLGWLRTRPGSSHVGHAAPDGTLTLLGGGPAAALGKEADMWYRGTSLIKKGPTLGSYSSSMPRTLRKSCVWGGVFI